MSERPPGPATFPFSVLALGYAPIALYLVAQLIESNPPVAFVVGALAGGTCIWRIVRFVNRSEKSPINGAVSTPYGARDSD